MIYNKIRKKGKIQMKKEQKGVTLIALVVMIIIIVIIASITVYSGVSTLQDSREKRLIVELEMVQHAILEVYTKYKTVGIESYLVGEELTQDKIPEKYFNFINETAFLPSAQKDEKYYYLDKTILEDMGITNNDYTYIVNYSDGEVMNKDVQETATGKILYMSNDFKAFE